jgi:hypothetical protein
MWELSTQVFRHNQAARPYKRRLSKLCAVRDSLTNLVPLISRPLAEQIKEFTLSMRW